MGLVPLSVGAVMDEFEVVVVIALLAWLLFAAKLFGEDS